MPKPSGGGGSLPVRAHWCVFVLRGAAITRGLFQRGGGITVGHRQISPIGKTTGGKKQRKYHSVALMKRHAGRSADYTP